MARKKVALAVGFGVLVLALSLGVIALVQSGARAHRIDALKHLGAAAYAQGDYRTAYHLYLTADLAGGPPALDVKVGVAQSAAAAGDKATALSYFRQAEQLARAQHASEADLDGYDDQIRNLGGTP